MSSSRLICIGIPCSQKYSPIRTNMAPRMCVSCCVECFPLFLKFDDAFSRLGIGFDADNVITELL
jgi:hypothetical protein